MLTRPVHPCNSTHGPMRSRGWQRPGTWLTSVGVRFFRLDKLRVEQALKRYVASLAEDPRVLAVVLFGSHARGDATAMSDADVVIILSDHNDPFHVRASAFLRPGIGISMDVFPYTLDEAFQA